METRHRVLGLAVTFGLYAAFVLWPRTVPKAPPAGPAPAPSRPVTTGRSSSNIPPVAVAGGGGYAPLPERGDLSLPPRPKIALNVVPPVPAAAGGSSSPPYRTARPRKPGKTDAQVAVAPAPWEDPSGAPVLYLRPNNAKASKKDTPEKRADKMRQKHKEKLASKGNRPGLMRRAARMDQFLQQRSQARQP